MLMVALSAVPHLVQKFPNIMQPECENSRLPGQKQLSKEGNFSPAIGFLCKEETSKVLYSERTILVNNQLDALFQCIYYFTSLHVSSNPVLIIRRFNCINTSSGIYHSV
jgi:hypothetical protein